MAAKLTIARGLATRRVALLVEAAIGQRTTEAIVEEQEEQRYPDAWQ